MINNEVQNISNQQRMLANNPLNKISDYARMADQVNSSAKVGTALTYDAVDIASKFENHYTKKDKKQSYQDYSNKMLQSQLDTSEGTLKATHTQMQNLKTQSKDMSQIAENNNKLDGTKAELQGVSQMLNENGTQLQAIEQLQAQSNAQQATYIASQVAREIQSNHADHDLFNYKVNYPKYADNSQLDYIPSI
jgi:P-type conjugative transfer protein TrbJ